MSKVKYLVFKWFGKQVSEMQHLGHGDFSEYRYLKLFNWYLDLDEGKIYKFKG
ncbi:MAG: hypothetical protein GY777_01305 [Candidatus Brocadiaceae bacterium]|nr:hypothetical protein [Candidatus Brocadiaceae bacterium]